MTAAATSPLSYTLPICSIAGMRKRLTPIEIEYWLLTVLVRGLSWPGCGGGVKALL